MTGSRTLAVAGRVGIVLSALLAFQTFVLPWFSDGGDRIVIGLGLVYIKHEMPAGTHPYSQAMIEPVRQDSTGWRPDRTPSPPGKVRFVDVLVESADRWNWHRCARA